MAQIKKRNGAYTIIVSCGYDGSGKQVTRSTTFRPDPGLSPAKEAKALQKFAMEFENRIKAGNALDGSMKFADFIEIWRKKYAEKHLKPLTVASYDSSLALILPAFGNLRMEKIQPMHVMQWLENMQEKGINRRGGKLAPSTIKEKFVKIKTLFSIAAKWQIIEKNPCDRVEAPKAPKKEAVFFDGSDLACLLDALDALPAEKYQYRTMILLLIYTGMRRGELCGLEWKDVDLKTGTITIERTVFYTKKTGLTTGTPKTEGSARKISIPADAVQLLEDHRHKQRLQRIAVGADWEESDRIFAGWKGEAVRPQTITKWFSRFCQRSGLPGYHLHSLRHTSASLLIASGQDIRTVSGRLGHSSTSTTLNIYAHLLEQADKTAGDAVAAAIKAAR